MIVLAIESATELVAVAVGDDEGARAGVWAAGRRRHAEALAPAIVHALDQAEVALSDVGVVAVDLGPGLFTGLRVGVATAKGLAQGLGVGVVGVTSLELLAQGAFDAGWRGEVASVVDARRGEVFLARYLARGKGVAQVAAPRRATPEELAADLADSDEVLAVGDGARRYAGAIQGGGVTVGGPTVAAPNPRVLVDLALQRVGAAQPPAQVRPVYLRDADVRINWARRAGLAGEA